MKDLRLEGRKQTFKIDSLGSVTRKREAYALQLRKGKKQEVLQKKRLQAWESDTLSEAAVKCLSKKNQIFSDPAIPLNAKAEVAAKLLSEPIDDAELLYNLARVVRQAMKDEAMAKGEFIKKYDLLPKLAALLDVQERNVQYEIVWAVLDAAMHSQNCDELAKLGCHIKVAKLISTTDLELTEECIIAIKNLIDDNPSTRDDLLKSSLLPSFLQLLTQPNVKAPLRALIFQAVQQLCKTEPLPPFEPFSAFLPFLEESIAEFDPELTSSALWALCYIADCKDTALESIISKPVIVKASQLLSSSIKELKHAAVYLAGVICSGPNSLIDLLMDQSPLPAIAKILETPTEDQIVWDACFMLRNLVVGPFRHLKALVDSGILKTLISFLSIPSISQRVRKYALECIANTIHFGTEAEVEELVKEGVLEGLAAMLSVKEAEVLKMSIVTLDNIFVQYEQQGEPEDILATFDAIEGVDKMSVLVSHSNADISKLANEFLNTHFYVHELPEDYEQGPLEEAKVK